MSDFSQGIGWWQARDGKWYPPEPNTPGVPPADRHPDVPHPPEMHPPVLMPPENHPPATSGPTAQGLGGDPAPWVLATNFAARPVPDLASPDPEPHRRRPAIGPVFLVVGALALLAVGAGSAVGIGYAMRSSPTTTVAASPPTTIAGSDNPNQPVPKASEPGAAGSPPRSTSVSSGSPSVTAAAPSSQAAGPAPPTETGPPGNLVTPAVADDVLATTWAGYRNAMVSDDRASLSDYTTPSALNDSIGTLDCGCLPGPLTYSTTAISTPPQTSYPLSFMAGLSGLGYNQQSQTWWVVFTKKSVGTPWVIAFFASYAEGDGLDGFTSNSASTPMAVQYPLQNAPQAYADYFQNLDATGNPGGGAPAHFAQDNILTSEVTNTTQLDNRYTAEGLHEAFFHTVDQVSPIFAQVVNGSVVGAMECFSVTVTNNVTSAKGSPIVQPANQQAWGYQIPPGSYSSLNFTKDDGACVEESATSGITLTSDSGGTYAISTTPSG